MVLPDYAEYFFRRQKWRNIPFTINRRLLLGRRLGGEKIVIVIVVD